MATVCKRALRLPRSIALPRAIPRRALVGRVRVLLRWAVGWSAGWLINWLLLLRALSLLGV